MLVTELTRRIGSDILNIGHPWGGDVVSVGGVGITANRAIAIVVAAVLHRRCSSLAFKYSSWGVAMRAAAEDGEAAALMGIRLGRVVAAAWMIARRARRGRRPVPRRLADPGRHPGGRRGRPAAPSPPPSSAASTPPAARWSAA